MPADEKFSVMKALSGPFNWRNYVKLLVYGICALIVWTVVTSVMDRFFPKKHHPEIGNASRVKVEQGGTASIVNNNFAAPDLKQGIYGRLSSTGAGIGVFKEVTPNIDVSLGGNKAYDGDEYTFEVETRYKF